MRAKGLRQFLEDEQQHAWLNGAALFDTADRPDSLEQRFKYVARFEKLLRRPQAQEVLDILRLYAANCIPIPRRTERPPRHPGLEPGPAFFLCRREGNADAGSSPA